MSLSSVLPPGTKSSAPSDCPQVLSPPVLALVLLAVIFQMFANNSISVLHVGSLAVFTVPSLSVRQSLAKLISKKEYWNYVFTTIRHIVVLAFD